MRQFQFASLKTGGPGRVEHMACAGRLVAGHGAERSAWAPLLGARPSPHVELDVSGITEVDAAGLGALADAYRSVVAGGGSLRLVGLRPRIRRLLEVTGLDRAVAAPRLARLRPLVPAAGACDTVSLPCPSRAADHPRSCFR